MNREELHASISFPQQAVHFYVGRRDEDKREILSAEGWKSYTPGFEADPSFTVSMEAAQVLFEELWAQGLRSSRDRGSSDRLDQARQEHLADLRKVAKLT